MNVHAARHALATIDACGIGTLQLRDASKLNIVGSRAIGDVGSPGTELEFAL